MHLQRLSIGQYLRKLRGQRRETLNHVSIGSGIDSPLLSRIERGNRLPTNDQLRRLSEYFHISENDLKVLLVAEKIIKTHGISHITYDALKLVEEQLEFHLKTKENESC